MQRQISVSIGYLMMVYFLLFMGEITPAQIFPSRTYGGEEEIPAGIIRDIYQDSKGYLWLLTSRGLLTFDGIEFKSFPGTENERITTVLEDGKGGTWIGTLNNGVLRRRGNAVQRYTVKEGLPGNHIYTISKDKNGWLWFGSGKGAAKFDGANFTAYTIENGLRSNMILASTIDKDGNPWFGTDNGISRYTSEGFVNYTTADGLLGNEISRMYTDSKGRIWSITAGTGANCFSRGKFHSYRFEIITIFGPPRRTISIARRQTGSLEKLGLAGYRRHEEELSAIMEDHRGTIWFATRNGICFLSGEKFLSPLTFNVGMMGGGDTMLEDRDGNIWIGRTRHLHCLYSLKVNNIFQKGWSRDVLKKNFTWAIIQDQEGHYWFGTDGGLTRYASYVHNRHFTEKDGLPSERVYGLLEDRRGNIWVGTENGIGIYSKSTGTFTNVKLSGNRFGNIVRVLMEDGKGNVLAGTDRGLKLVRPGKITAPPFRFPPVKVNCLLEDRAKNLWAGTDEGLFRISKEKTTRFTEEDGLPHHMIYALLEDSDGSIRVGTGRGLGSYQKGTFVNAATEQGLDAGECFSILEDHRGYLWIGTATGIHRFDGKTFKLLTKEKDGIISDTCLPGSCFKDRDGNLLFGSTRGITRINPVLDTAPAVAPKIHITRVKVRDKVVSSLGRLPHRLNSVSFKFSGICFAYPQGVTYRYKLEGLEKEWLETKERVVSYPYLPPRSYTFRVKAVNSEGVESLETAAMSFSIQPPFWNAWWFRTLTAISFMVFLGILLSWRFKREREKAVLKEKNRQLMMAQRMELVGTLAAGAAHDLKNLLTIILGYSRVVKSQFEQDDPRNMPAEYIKDTAQTAVKVVKEILAFSRQQEGRAILVNLADLLEEILNIVKVLLPAINIRWEPPREEVLFVINPTHFHQVLMNLCINASDAMPKGGSLDISLHTDTAAQTIILEVADTGTGIPEEMLEKIFEPMVTTKEPGKGTGLGLFVVKQIVRQYGGTISVHSIRGQGTAFTITFPIPPDQVSQTEPHT